MIFDNAFGDLIAFFGTAGSVLIALGVIAFAGFLFRSIGQMFDSNGETFEEMPLIIASLLAVVLLAVISLFYSAFFGGRTTLRTIILVVAAIAAAGWLFRLAGQKYTGSPCSRCWR